MSRHPWLASRPVRPWIKKQRFHGYFTGLHQSTLPVRMAVCHSHEARHCLTVHGLDDMVEKWVIMGKVCIWKKISQATSTYTLWLDTGNKCGLSELVWGLIRYPAVITLYLCPCTYCLTCNIALIMQPVVTQTRGASHVSHCYSLSRCWGKKQFMILHTGSSTISVRGLQFSHADTVWAWLLIQTIVLLRSKKKAYHHLIFSPSFKMNTIFLCRHTNEKLMMSTRMYQ